VLRNPRYFLPGRSVLFILFVWLTHDFGTVHFVLPTSTALRRVITTEVSLLQAMRLVEPSLGQFVGHLSGQTGFSYGHPIYFADNVKIC
jgi:hypothetical protein